MEKKIIREEKTKTTVLKVYLDEEGNETEEYYAPVRGELKRCSKTWWGTNKFWEKMPADMPVKITEEFYRSKLGADYKRALGMK